MMKTTTYAWPMADVKRTGWGMLFPAMLIGVVSAVLVYRVAAGGVFGVSGEQLPYAVSGVSAWLYAGFALGSRHWMKGLAHLGFAVALFAGALAAMGGSVVLLSPWFLAQCGWVLWHRRDIGQPLFVAGWVAFNLVLGLALLG